MGDQDVKESTKLLRRNMFICNSEREKHLEQAKMMRVINMHLEDAHRSEFGFYKKNQSQPDYLNAFSYQNRALWNVDILENIGSYLCSKDLLNCRRVCKLWSLEIGRLYKKRKTLIVVEEDCAQAETLLKKRAEGNPVVLSKLCLFDINPGCRLYKKLFAMFGWTLSSVALEECQLSPKDLIQVLLCDAPNIDSFSFKEVEVEARQPSRVSTFKIMKTLNKGNLALEKLKMLYWDDENDKTDLKDIVDACFNLVTLELRNCTISNPAAFKNSSWSTLRSVFLSPKNVLSVDHCKALTNLNLKLQKVTLFGINPHDKAAIKSLSKFLANLSETLEILELWLDYVSVLGVDASPTFSPFPIHLPKLIRLQTESEIVGHIKHLSKLPLLTELEVVSNPHQRQKWDELTRRTPNMRQESLHSFRCGDIDAKSLNKVIKLFPHINTLHIYATHVNDSFFRSIITSLPTLVDLSISTCVVTHKLRLTDSGITGISEDQCKKLTKDPTKLAATNIDSLKTRPGISDLKLLQKLDLGLQTSTISDVSVFLGVSAVAKLCCLKLPVCKITDASLMVIEERLPALIVLGIAGCSKISSEAILSFKSRRKGIFIENDLPPLFEDLSR